MHPNEALLTGFYTAFQEGNFTAMQHAYHEGATFHDPVFEHLKAEQVKAMWQMLLTSAKDLSISFSGIHANDTTGRCHWEARYTFSRTGRKVHNVIEAGFVFRESKIFEHRDSFDFWRWSRQALGPSGLLLGWSPLVRNKVRAMAKANLRNFMHQEGRG
ncbi:MAG TPA: nuclear transport factor 2 family protein [Ohtaekwangia sp.]|nr:nuclear transport factor 2 family protein [Ohtaekwangia sp.]